MADEILLGSPVNIPIGLNQHSLVSDINELKHGSIYRLFD